MSLGKPIVSATQEQYMCLYCRERGTDYGSLYWCCLSSELEYHEEYCTPEDRRVCKLEVIRDS